MVDDEVVAGPSLFLAGTEKAHREHIHQHNFFHLHLHQHQHQHQNNDKRQLATQIEISQVVTEVTQTVSYVQQIDVDSNGITFSIQTVLASPTTDVPTTSDTAANSSNASPAATITDPAVPVLTNTASSASSTASGTASSTASGTTSSGTSSASQSLISNSSTTTLSSSASSIPTSSFTLLTSSNSTTLIPVPISIGSSQVQSFSNSTVTSASSSSISSFTYLVSSSSSSNSNSNSASSDVSSTYDPSASISSIASSSTNSYTSSGYIATPTAIGTNGGTPGATGAGTGATSSSTSAAGSGSDSDSSSTVSTGSVVGGVVGGVAGAAIIVFLLMLLLKWHKRRGMTILGSGEPGSAGTRTARAIGPSPPTQPPGGMTGPRTGIFAVPAALASLAGIKRKPGQAAAPEPVEERGFYRVSGRKLPSVLQSGGDGYGDGVADSTNTNTLSGSSFYRDSQGFYGGTGPAPGSPTLASPIDTSRPISGIPIMRPSPARTPEVEHPFAFGPQPASLSPSQRPLSPGQRELAGRSLVSQDGSHASRFTEEV